MKARIIHEMQHSDSYKVLERVNQRMPLHYHCHTHVLYDLRTLFGDRPVTYLEIGSLNGSSGSTMMQHPMKTHVICVDPLELPEKYHPGYGSHEEVLRANLTHFQSGENTFEIIKGYSHDPEVLDKLRDRNVQVDILFIDGDHSKEAAMRDFFLYSHLVKRGGFIVVDDYLDGSLPTVKEGTDRVIQFVQEAKLPFEIVGLVPNVQRAQPQWEYLNEFIFYRK